MFIAGQFAHAACRRRRNSEPLSPLLKIAGRPAIPPATNPASFVLMLLPSGFGARRDRIADDTARPSLGDRCNEYTSTARYAPLDNPCSAFVASCDQRNTR